MHKIRGFILKLTLLVLILSPMIFLVGALGSKFGLFSWQFGLGKLTFNYGPKALMATAGLGVLSLLLAVLVRPRRGFMVALLAIIVAGAGLLHAKSVRTTAQTLPFIHDVSTDTLDPPKFSDAMLALRNKTVNVNSADYVGKVDSREGRLVSELQSEAYPNISTRVYDKTPAQMFDMSLQAVEALGWDIVTQDENELIIEATETTFWFGFKDDVIIRIRESSDTTGSALVDVRSLSRVGGSDLAANAARIERFFSVLEDQ